MADNSAQRDTAAIKVSSGRSISGGMRHMPPGSELLGSTFFHIGIPIPGVMAPFVGVVELACGLLLVAGLLTRLAAIPLIIDMLMAISTTKLPLLARVRKSTTAGAFLDGVNVASLGLMVWVTVEFARTALVDAPTMLLGLVAAILIFRWKVNTASPVGAGAVVGLLVQGWP
jgi:chromate transport protein ChrA